MSKVLIIGIDGLDKIMLSKFEESLPNFSKLKAQSPDIKFESVFPPDTMPAWVSIYTGLNPAKHGVIHFLDSRNKDAKVIIDGVDNNAFRGKAFWDIASEANKKVCVVLPYAVYPAYPVNGLMVCRTLKVVPENFPASTYPQSLFKEFGLSNVNLNLFHGFPSRKSLARFIESCRSRTLNEANIGLRLLKSQGWDLFFIYMSALDAIQHTFWSYFDEKHPDYPGQNSYENVIKDFYVLFDRLVGEFMGATDEDTVVIVVSDHGHGMRPVKLVNINEVLRRKGYLVPKSKKLKPGNRLVATDFLKSKSIDFVDRFGIGFLALKLMHRFPIWKKVFTSPAAIDWNKTSAYVSDLSAIKCYTYCGIMINRSGLDNEKYEQLRSQIIYEFTKLPDPVTGENLVSWCCRREELYSGDYISKYPDILLELNGDYGAGWSIGVPIKTMSKSRGIQPGTHRAHSAVLLVSNISPRKFVRKSSGLMDIAPTILHILGIENAKFDGSSLIGR